MHGWVKRRDEYKWQLEIRESDPERKHNQYETPRISTFEKNWWEGGKSRLSKV
jgi:hypothetical protein